MEFRTGLVIGLGATLAVGLYCLWLWQGERQIARHTQTLFRRIEQKDWNAVAQLIADDYHDQWNDDRGLLLERMRLVLGFGRHFHISESEVTCRIDNRDGVWRGRIMVESDDPEFAALAKERINGLVTPFEFHWRRVGKPWEWKLVRVSNSDLDLPAGFE